VNKGGLVESAFDLAENIPTFFIFSEPDNGQHFTNHFNRLIKVACVGRITFHELRHTHISHQLINWVHVKIVSEQGMRIEKLSEDQIDKLVAAVNENGEVRYSFGFRSKKPFQHGDGLIPHLHRLGGRKFALNEDAKIVPAAETAARRQIVDDDLPF
jgi:hypothetical protein